VGSVSNAGGEVQAFEQEGMHAAHKLNAPRFAISDYRGAAGATAVFDSDHRCRGRVIHFDERKKNMAVRKVEIERLSVTNELVDAVSASLGSADARNEQRANNN